MKLGLNLWIWDAPFRTDRHLALIPLVRALGGEVVEFALEDDSVVDEQLLKRTLADEELACSVVGLFGPDRDLSEDSAAARQNGLAYARRCIDLCAGVGATLFSGAVAGCGGKEPLSPDLRRSRIERAAESLRELGDYAAQAGVGVAVEILNRYENNLLTTAAHGRELIDLTDHPAVGIHLDSFHMGLEETDLGGAIRLAGDRLVHFHGNESHRGTPGTGVVPWGQVADGLQATGYDGYVIIESFNHLSWIGPLAHFWRPLTESPESLGRDGLAFLKRALQR